MKEVLQLETLAGIYPKLRKLEFARRVCGEASLAPSDRPRAPEKTELLRTCRYALLFRCKLEQAVADGKPVIMDRYLH